MRNLIRFNNNVFILLLFFLAIAFQSCSKSDVNKEIPQIEAVDPDIVDSDNGGPATERVDPAYLIERPDKEKTIFIPIRLISIDYSSTTEVNEGHNQKLDFLLEGLNTVLRHTAIQLVESEDRFVAGGDNSYSDWSGDDVFERFSAEFSKKGILTIAKNVHHEEYVTPDYNDNMMMARITGEYYYPSHILGLLLGLEVNTEHTTSIMNGEEARFKNYTGGDQKMFFLDSEIEVLEANAIKLLERL